MKVIEAAMIGGERKRDGPGGHRNHASQHGRSESIEVVTFVKNTGVAAMTRSRGDVSRFTLPRLVPPDGAVSLTDKDRGQSIDGRS